MPAMPGMLPVINAICVEQAVRTGLGLNAQINLRSVFDRKNYFYADLPAGYQISQFTQPIVGKGTIVLDLPDGETREVGITRLHLEQDAGKSLHDQHPTKTYVDLNRSGVALMEIVSEPDMRSAEEAAAYLRKLRSILRYLGTCDGNMEEGSMRCDVNVSVRKPGEPLGTRCEIKNVNSIRFVQQAIEYEARRQIEVHRGRRHDQAGDAAVRRQQGRDALDALEGGRARLPLLPRSRPAAAGARPGLGRRDQGRPCPNCRTPKQARFMTDYGLSRLRRRRAGRREGDRRPSTRRSPRARDAKLAANWVIGELFGPLNKAGKSIAESPVSAEALGGLLDLIADNTISGRIAKDVFAEMFETGKAPRPSSRPRACARSPTPARSRPRSTRSWPPTPTRSPSTAPARTSCSASSSAR